MPVEIEKGQVLDIPIPQHVTVEIIVEVKTYFLAIIYEVCGVAKSRHQTVTVFII